MVPTDLLAELLYGRQRSEPFWRVFQKGFWPGSRTGPGPKNGHTSFWGALPPRPPFKSAWRPPRLQDVFHQIHQEYLHTYPDSVTKSRPLVCGIRSVSSRQYDVNITFCLIDTTFALPSTNHRKKVDNRPIFRLSIWHQEFNPFTLSICSGSPGPKAQKCSGSPRSGSNWACFGLSQSFLRFWDFFHAPQRPLRLPLGPGSDQR